MAWKTLRALNATASAIGTTSEGPDRQYAGLKQRCALYTEVTRAFIIARDELLAQNRRDIKEA